jgi:putative thiamine transport system ATP-binding protein
MLDLQGMALRNAERSLINPFSLQIAKGEIVTIMGPSGSGKSSILAAIAGGLPDAITMAGDVLLNGKTILGLAPEKRNIGLLFQDDLLFPHMSVGENLLFATPGGATAERKTKVRAALRQAGLEEFESRAPHTLSGGQRQRVALMRCLLAEPQAILLDEPFSKLDATLRAGMREFVMHHIINRHIPALLVTHDRSDAPPQGRIAEILDGELRHA